MSNKLTSNAPIIAIIVTTLVWTITWVVSKHAMQYMGPFDFAAWRFGLGTLTLFVVLLIRRAPLKPTPFKLTFAIGMTQTAAFQALAQWALVSGGAGRVSMLVYTMPFWAVLFAWGLLRERPSPRQWLGIAVAVVGLVLVIEPWHDLGGWQSTSVVNGPPPRSPVRCPAPPDGALTWSVSKAVAAQYGHRPSTRPRLMK